MWLFLHWFYLHWGNRHDNLSLYLFFFCRWMKELLLSMLVGIIIEARNADCFPAIYIFMSAICAVPFSRGDICLCFFFSIRWKAAKYNSVSIDRTFFPKMVSSFCFLFVIFRYCCFCCYKPHKNHWCLQRKWCKYF